MRVAVQSVSDKTAELLYTLPVSRKMFLLIQLLSNFTMITVFFVLQYVVMSFHSFGPTGLIDQDKIGIITIWGILFSLFGLLLGVLVGVIAGSTSKGHQISIIVALVSYVSKTVLEMNPNLNNLADLIPLTYYQPLEYLMFRSFVKTSTFFSITFPYYPVILLVFGFILIFICLQLFERKDLTADARFNVCIFKRFNSENKQKKSFYRSLFKTIVQPFIFIKNIFFPKKIRNNPFIFWARIFEKRIPFVADFIYSDNVILIIAFFALFLLFPFQIGYYPGYLAVEKSINTFGKTKIFSVFTYGHNLSNIPYLWFLCVNSIGIIWIIFLPLCFLWVMKAFIRDGNTGYGEILGGITIDNKQVVFQRLLAIFVELLVLVFVACFWLLITELLNGQTYNQLWEIISIISLLPFYFFIISLTSIMALFFNKKGFFISVLFFMTVLLSFIISFLSPSTNFTFLSGIFSLYDPIAIIEKKSIFINGNGIAILIFLDISSIIGLFKCSSDYTWLNISQKSKMPI